MNDQAIAFFQVKSHTLLFYFILFAGTLPSMAQADRIIPQFKSAIEYHDFILEEQTLFTKGMSKLTDAINESNSGEIKSCLNAQLTQAKGSWKLMKKMPEYNGNEEFRNSAILLFEFYYKMTKNQITKIVKIVDKVEGVTIKEKNHLDKLNKQIEKKETVQDDSFNKALEKFAKDNNFVQQ